MAKMTEPLVNSVKKSYKRYTSLLYAVLLLTVVIIIGIGVLTYGQLSMSARPTYGGQKSELTNFGGRSKDLGFTSAFYFISPLTGILLGLLVVGFALGMLTFRYVEPAMDQFIIDEAGNTLGFEIRRKFFRNYEIDTERGKIFLKFIPYRKKSIEWCLFRLESPIDQIASKDTLEEIAFRHMLSFKENKIRVVCNLEEVFLKLLLMINALDEIKQLGS